MSWPKNVGILAIELIFPARYVDQEDLEVFDGVNSGKYVLGLSQKEMGFCTDREDINSLCLTVVHKLMERHNIKYTDIGRLEVGTETIIDKSKSVKTVLMQLFEPHGATNIEGVDTTNACYGGTAALFNAISWVESSAWDERYALVVAGDIAVYAEGPARPTGGAGAVAMLVGPNAPLVIERGLRATYMRHTYDFYKPDMTSEYPTVDGRLSIQCYLQALDNCYQLYCKKSTEDITVDRFNAILFHSPYCKLVYKSLSRLYLNDFVRNPSNFPKLQHHKSVKLEDTYFSKDIETEFMVQSKEIFKTKTEPSLLLASKIGNMYTPSLYSCLVSYLISENVENLAGNKVGLFSYGSGLASTFYSIKVSSDFSENSPLNKLVTNLSHIKPLLNSRKRVSAQEFCDTLANRAKNSHAAPFAPQGPIDDLFPGTYYLDSIDEKHRRFYKRTADAENVNGKS